MKKIHLTDHQWDAIVAADLSDWFTLNETHQADGGAEFRADFLHYRPVRSLLASAQKALTEQPTEDVGLDLPELAEVQVWDVPTTRADNSTDWNDHLILTVRVQIGGEFIRLATAPIRYDEITNQLPGNDGARAVLEKLISIRNDLVATLNLAAARLANL